MVFLKRFFNFYIFSNLHVSVAAFCLTKLTLLMYHIDENKIPFFVFFATFISYNFIRFYNIDNIKSVTSVWIKSHKSLLISLNFISVLFLLKLTFDLNPKSYILMIPLILGTFFYSVPFLFLRKNLRDITGLKLFLITIIWSAVTVLLPLNNAEISFSSDVWLVFLQRFLFLFAITIPFDIRDIDFDDPKIKTLPQVVGVKNSKFLGSAALLLFFVIEFFKDIELMSSIVITLTISIVSFAFLIFSSNKQSKYYSSFWIETLPIVWFLLVFFTE